MTAILAALPLLIVLFAMGALRWSAALSGAVGLTSAIVLAATMQGISGIVDGAPAMAAIGIGAEAAHSTAAIIWIILPALALYEYQHRSGGIDRIRDALSGLTSDRRIHALLLAWFFGLFVEGAAGFGTPVALAAPLLVGIGFTPVRAVTIALLGHAAGVPFGAVGTPSLAQVQISGLPPQALAGATAGLNVLIGMGLLLAVMKLADERPITGRDLAWTATAGACFLVPYVIIAALTGPELPTLAGALIGLVAFVTALRLRSAAALPNLRGLGRDTLPYLILIALVLITRLAPQVRAPASTLTWEWELYGLFEGSFAPLFHPGSLLLASLLIGAAMVGRFYLVLASLRAAARRLLPVALALLFMLALSRVMVHSGMIATLAQSAAHIGGAWPLFAPLVGTIGTFVSGSATASNILLTQFQIGTAAALDLSPTTIAAGQAVGAAIGNIVAPHNIIAGCATVGLVGREGTIVRRTAPACLAALVVAGVLTLTIAS